jgi:signal transduction histidine kinase
VAARWQDKALLRNAAGESTQVEFRDGIDIPAVGESIEAAGSPVTDLYRTHLVEAVWRKSGAAQTQPDQPINMPLKTLFKSHGVFIMNPRFFGRTLSVKGTLREFVTDEGGRKRLLLENGGLTIQIDCSNAPDATMIQFGSVVSATGVCVLDSDIWRPSAPFPKNKSLFLVARGPDDIVVLKRPSWWTPAKFIAAVSVMGGVIVLFLVWNASLRVLVGRRTREAIKAQERKIESELRVAERTRLAADLHDSFSQNLSVIGYHVAALQTSLARADEVASVRLSTVAKMIKSCLMDLRRCLWDLRNDVLDEPNFAEAIQRTVEPVARDAELQIRFDGRRALLSDATAHALLNIVRELVANAVVHGEAKNVRIAGEVHAGGISLSVRDDGRGFDPDNRPGTGEGHFGIDGIKARLERIGGTLTIESSPGNGTKAFVLSRKS